MMQTEQAVTAICEARERELVVTTMSALGLWPDATSRDFRLLGLMGAAGSIGLGLAIGLREETVWVIDGDGSLMMQLGVLGAVADARPARFVHVVIANGIYAISGAQRLPAHACFDWTACALAAGYADAAACGTPDELIAALQIDGEGPRLVVAQCDPARPEFAPGAFAVDVSGDAARMRAALVSKPIEEGA